MVRVVGLEPTSLAALEPKGAVTLVIDFSIKLCCNACGFDLDGYF